MKVYDRKGHLLVAYGCKKVILVLHPVRMLPPNDVLWDCVHDLLLLYLVQIDQGDLVDLLKSPQVVCNKLHVG